MTSYVDPSALMIIGADFSPCAQRTLRHLRRHFPGAFGQVQPLAIGIYAEVMSRAQITGQEATAFFAFYTQTHAYLAACAAPRAMRHDLDGNPVCPVSEADQQFAAARLADRSKERSISARWLGFRSALLEPVAMREEPDA